MFMTNNNFGAGEAFVNIVPGDVPSLCIPVEQEDVES